LLDGAGTELEQGLPMRALALCTALSAEAASSPQATVIRAIIAVFLGRRAAALDILRSTVDPPPTIRRLTAEILVSDFGNLEAAMEVTDDPAAQRTLRLRADLLALPPRAVLARCADLVDGRLIAGGDPGAAERLHLEMASVRAQCHAYIGEAEAAESLIQEVLDSPVHVGPINRRRLGRGISRALLALGRDPGRLRSARWGRPSDGAMLDVSTRQIEHAIHLLTSGAPIDEFRTQVDQLQDVLMSPLPQLSWLPGAAEVLEIIGYGHVASSLDDPLPVIDSIEAMRAYSPIHGMLLVAGRVIIAAPGRIATELEDALELLTDRPGLVRLLVRTVALRRFSGLTPATASRLADALGAHDRDIALTSLLLARAAGDEKATCAAFEALVADPSAGIDPRGIAVLLSESGLADSPAARTLTSRHPATRPLLAPQRDTVPAPLASPVVLAQLTEREVDVALEATRGSSNMIIAASLGISKRTVETHLRNIYRKLDVTSRQELYAELLA
jgi:DNA-binding CsgD family transcriptional regulator